MSNLRVGDNAVSVIKLNPPYDMMVDFSENTSWLGWKYGNITFENEVEINIEEIRELLDDGQEKSSS